MLFFPEKLVIFGANKKKECRDYYL